MAWFGRKEKGYEGEGAAPAPTAPGGVEGRIFEIGSEMLGAARSHKAGLLSKQFYQDKLMDWSMKDHEFKVQMFRFVDAFPALTTPEMVHEHLRDYMSQPGVSTPPGMDLALKAGSVAKGLATKTIASQITNMAHTFIAGTDAVDALPVLERLWKNGLAFSVDLLGEACVSGDEADMYRDKYLDLVENLVGAASGWSPNERLERDHMGTVPRVNVSVKASSLCAVFDPIAPDRSIEDFMARAAPILAAARRNGVLINFDMEHFALKDLTLDAFEHACGGHDFEAGLAMQAYLKSGVEDARRIGAWAKRTGRVVTVRLVKGAYWDYETIHAEQEGWPCPVWNEKWQTDECFERMVEVLLDHGVERGGEGGVKLALGSHNVRSIAAALASLERRGLPPEAIELQMLHGMADPLKHAATRMGLRVREYVPVGEMIPGMAYLVRRLLENTSNESWLKAGFHDGADASELLAPPESRSNRHATPDLADLAPERHALTPGVEGVGDGRPFYSEPTRDFSDRAQREAFGAAVERATVPAVENDKAPRDADEMLERARGAIALWRDFDPVARADVLTRTAAKMRLRRDGLAGIMCKESRKPWREADADVCEAIDFLEYYARLAPALFAPTRLGRFIGELDELWHQPKGVAVVISPWNFPLAICTGMTSAALVTGNPTIVKPAEQSVGIAHAMFEIMRETLREVGAPPGALQFCPAPGETTGAALVRDPRVSVLAFTGSKAVGLDIIKAAGLTHEDQTHVKRVVCEMGGKNAVIVDAGADLDEAVLGVRYSAFGFSGQKCSACSRCIVVDPEGRGGAHTRLFLERLGGSTRTLVLGSPENPGTDVGPVIDAQAAASIRGFIERAHGEGLEELVGAKDFTTDGLHDDLVPPHIFTGVERGHELACREVFGPVLAVMHARSFDEALEIANESPYKLTGGVFTRRPAHIHKARREFRVGNLYINRGCTGALVGRHPFGGFGMSGVGSKAGGPEYLLQFVDPRACAENTMRRGFAPEL